MSRTLPSRLLFAALVVAALLGWAPRRPSPLTTTPGRQPATNAGTPGADQPDHRRTVDHGRAHQRPDHHAGQQHPGHHDSACHHHASQRPDYGRAHQQPRDKHHGTPPAPPAPEPRQPDRAVMTAP